MHIKPSVQVDVRANERSSLHFPHAEHNKPATQPKFRTTALNKENVVHLIKVQ